MKHQNGQSRPRKLGRTPTGAASAKWLAQRRPTHSEPDVGAFYRSPRMKCGWGCGDEPTGRQLHALPICPKRSAASERRDRRGRCSKGKRELPLRTPQTAAHAESPAPIPFGGPAGKESNAGCRSERALQAILRVLSEYYPRGNRRSSIPSNFLSVIPNAAQNTRNSITSIRRSPRSHLLTKL